MRFQFDGISYNDLIKLFAQNAGKPILGEFSVSGTLTFHDAEPYTYDEALDTLNLLLAMKSFWLLEKERYFQVIPLTQVPGTCPILPGMADLDQARPGEVVTVVLPLQYMDPTTASKTVVRMVSSWGSISPLPRGKGLVITDSAMSIQRINSFLKLLDSQDVVEGQIRIIRLENAAASQVVATITRLFGTGHKRRMERNPVTGRYEVVTMGLAEGAMIATADERTNSIILYGGGDKLELAAEMIRKLDEKQPDTAGAIRIFELENAKAEEVANTLRQLVTGSTGSTTATRYDRYRRPIPSSTPGGSPVRIVADATTNRLIVSAPPDKMVQIEKLIKDLDIASKDLGGMRVFRLKAADAQQLSSVVSSTLSMTSRDRYGRTTTTSAVRVSADPRTNSLIVAGSAADIQMAQAIIEELDKEGEKDLREIHVVHLKAGNAQDIANALVRIFSPTSASPSSSYNRYSRYPRPPTPSSSSIRVEADTTTNSLLIACTPGDWPKIREILDQLEANIATLATPVTRRIPLKAAKAEELAETLRQIFGGGTSRYTPYGSRYGSRYSRPSTAGGRTVPVNIIADRNTNSLIVSAAEDDHQAIIELVQVLDVPPTEKIDPIRMIRLESAEAARVVATLQAMLPSDPRGRPPDVYLYADTTSNTVLLRAPEGKREMLEQMIASLDKETRDNARETRIIPLQHISAQEVATMLSQLYPGASAPQPSYSRYRRFSRPSPVAGSSQRVVISPAPGDRAIVVDGPKSQVEEIAQLVKMLDTPDAGRIAIRTYDLPSAKAPEVAASLSALFAQRMRGRAPGGSTTPEPRFEANAATNQLLVAATTAQFEEIEKVIKDIQKATLLVSETKTFQLKFAKAADLVEVLQTMLTEEGAAAPVSSWRSRFTRRRPTSSSSGGVRVAALVQANAIVVQGPPEKLALAEKLITSFDVPDVMADTIISRLPLENARAEALVETLRAMLPPTPRGQEAPVVIEADRGTNSILLRGPEAERTRIEEIIAQLDKETTDQTREVRILPLKQASATQLAMTLQQLYSGSASASPALRYYRGRTRRPTTGTDDERVIITAAPDDKSLVVEAPKTKIDEIAQLVEALDVAWAPALEKRIYLLKNVKAAELAESLRRLYGAQGPTGRTGRTRPPGASASGEPEPRFEADTATNQLFVAGTPKQLAEIDQFIRKVDTAVLASEIKTFKLQFARATEIVGVLETMLAEAAQAAAPSRFRSRFRRPTSPAAAGGVRVAALEAINSIVVQGPPDKIKMAEVLIKTFDTPEAAKQTTVRLIPLANARAESVAAKLQAMLPPVPRGEESKVSIQADALTNSILLRGPESERKMLEELIAKLDEAAKGEIRETRIIELQHASASALADMLSQLYAGASPSPSRFFGSRYGRRTRTVVPAGDEAQRVIITAAPGDRALVVDAPKSKMDEIAQMVTKLDVKDTPWQTQVRTYNLVNSKAVDVASALARLFGEDRRAARGRTPAADVAEPQPRFDANPVTNQLLVVATAAQFEEIEKVIKELQATDATLAVQTKTFPLKFARATDLAEMLQTMLADEPARPTMGRFRGRGPTTPAGTVRVAAMPRSNAVVVQGPPTKVLLAEQLIKQFDSEEAGAQTIIEIVQLQKAQAATLAESINAALAARTAQASPFSRRRPGGAGAEQTVTVTPEPNSNSVLVRGPAGEVPGVVEMIKNLDEQGDSQAVQVRVFKLENSAAVDLAKSIDGLFRDILRQRGGTRGRAAQAVPFSVTGDDRTNTLVVHTTAANFRVVEEILKTLDQKGPLRNVEYFYLESADAWDVADKLNAMYTDRRGTARPVIEADDLANAVAVVAKDTDLKDIEDVIRKIDKAASADDQAFVRIVPLTRNRASHIAEIIQRVYSQMTDAEIIIKDSNTPSGAGLLRDDGNSIIFPSPPPDGPAGTRLFPPANLPSTWPASPDAAGASAPRAPASQPTTRPTTAPASQPASRRPRVTISVDRSSNTIMLFGPRQEIESIQAFIDQITAGAPDAEAEVRILRVQHADPAAIAQTIDALFNPRIRVPQQRQQQPQQRQPSRRGSGARPQQPQQIQLPKPQVTVVPDVRTRSVVVRAKPTDFEIIVPLVKALDQEAIVLSEVRIFTLKNTDAVEVASNLNELFALAARSARTPTPRPSSSKSKTPTPQQRRADWVRQMIELRGADGVTKVDPATAVSITSNRDTNSVIASAPSDVMKLVEKIVEELDQSHPLTRSVRMYPLKHAEVAPTVTALKEVFSGRGAITAASRGRPTGGARPQSGRDAPVLIAGDEASRLIIVSAPEEKHELVAKVIEEMDKAQAAGDVTVKVYRLEHADAQSTASALTGALKGASGGTRTRGRTPAASGGGSGSGQVRISADPSTNCLVVRASKEDHERIAALLEDMDKAPAAEYPVRTIALKNADAAEVAGTLSALFGGGGATRTTTGRRRATPTGKLESIIIEADPKARVVLVRADDETFAKIQEVVGKLDVVSAETPVVKMYDVKNAEIPTIVTALQQIFGGRGVAATMVSRRGPRRTGAAGEAPVVVIGDEFARKLIVSAPEEKHLLIAKTIEQIDTSQPAEAVSVQVYRLENAEAQGVALALAETLGIRRGGRSPRGGPTDTPGQLRLSADRSSNSIVIRASAQDHERIAKLIVELDAPPVEATYPVRVLMLKRADAAQMAELLNGLFGAGARPTRSVRRTRGSRGPGGRSGPTGSGKADAVIQSDVKAGMLLIRADDATFAKIKEIIDKLDVALVPVVKLYTVKNADVSAVVTALQQIFGSGAAAPTAARTRTRRVLTTSEAPVTIIGDETARKIIVAAPEDKHPLIAQVILDIDEAQPGGKVTVKVYRLEYAQAQTVAGALASALNLGGAGSARVTRRTPTGAAGGGQLRISADTSSNSLVVRASQEDHDRIAKLVGEMDQPAAAKYPVRTIPLKNADAEEMAATLQALFGPGGAARARRGMRTAPAGQTGVIIEADRSARRLLIRADDETFAKIQEIVTELDVAATGKPTPTILVLTHARAADLAPGLQASFAPARGRIVNPDDAVTIVAEPVSNSLIVTANALNLEKVRALVTSLDKADVGGTKTEFVVLKNAQASEVAGVLGQVSAGSGARGVSGYRGRTRRTPTAGGAQGVVVAFESSSNAVVISGPAKDVDELVAMAKKLDEAGAGGGVPTILPLKHAKATDLASTIQAAFAPVRGQRSSTQDAVTVVAEPLSNSLIVTAGAARLEKVQALVEKLDTDATGVARTELFVLKNARASEVATVLSQIAGAARGSAATRGRTRWSPGATPQQGVVVTAETSSNAIVLSGPDKDVARLLEMAKQIDEAAATTAVPVVKMYPVKNADIPTMVEALQEIFGAGGRTARTRSRGTAANQMPVVVRGDEAAKRIIVAAPEDKHVLIAKTIEEMDALKPDEAVAVKVYRLEHADAATIAWSLLNALNPGAVQTYRGGAGGTVAAGQIRITGDRSTNSLIVRASEDDHQKIAAMLLELDVAPGGKYPIRTIPLNNADATEVARVLTALFGGGGGGAGMVGRGTRGRWSPPTAAKGSVVIEADQSARMLLVRADDETFEKIREIAMKLDTAATGVATRTLIPLKHADAAAVAPALSQAFAAQRGSRITPDDLVTIVAEGNSNSLIVTANADNLKKVQALVEKLDTDTSGLRTELLVLKYARAADLAPILSQVGGGSGGVGRYRGRGAPSAQGMTVSADAASNALVITGPSAKVDQVMKMAVELDKASEATAVPVVKMYLLKNADVQTAAAYLQQIVAGTAARTTRARRFGAAPTGGEAPIVIIPDEPGKRLIVSAPADKHEIIAKVIKEFDDSQTGDPVIVKVYKIENTDAASVATALTTALNAGGATGRGRTTAAPSGGVTQQINITADRGSNSLIVRAPTSEHPRIAALIEEIDVSKVSKYPVRMIPLTTADPQQVAAVLNRLFEGGGGATGTGRTRRVGTTTGREKVIIEADPDSRMLVVRADDETFEKIRELAAKLDVPTGKATRTLLALKHAKADLIATSLSQAFAPQRGARVTPDDLVTVVADTFTNAIIVTADSVNLEKVKSLLAQLDTEQAGVRTEMFLLKHAKASELATVLTQIASGAAAARGRRTTAAATQAVTIAANDASNALIVSGPSAQVDEVMQMATQLDQATEQTISKVHVVPLKTGDAYTVAGMVRDLYSQQERAARANRQSIDALAVTADERANALLIATTENMFQTVSKWVADIEQMKPARGTMRLIQLKNVDPEEVEKAIQQLFNPSSSGSRGPAGVRAPRGRTRTGTSASGGAGRVQTSVLGQQRAILIQASDEDYEVIKQLAEALDKAAAAAKHQPKLFVLKRANNTRVAAALTSMYRPIRGVTPRPEDQVTVTALAQTNAIVVSAAEEKMKEVTHLIEELDKEEVAPPLAFRIYPLENAMPTKVLPALQQMLAQIRKLNPEETIDVQADERTKSIIVTAKGTLFDQIEKVIQALDKPPAQAKVDVLIIPLKKADATRLAEVLSDMIQPGADGQMTPEARALQQQIRLLRVRSTVKEKIPELDLTKPIKITADPIQSNQQGSNSLIISSTPENLEAMRAIVEIMDTVPLAEGANVRLIHLENADATSVQSVLQDIFTQGQRLAGREGSSVAGDAVPATRRGKALVYPLNVSADVRTNTLVLSGVEESLALAELVVKDLDREDGKIVTEVRLFKLQHADASRMLPLLQAVFGEQPPTGQAAGAEGLRTQVTRLRTALKDKLPKESKYAKTHPALTIQADTATNILIVAARSDIMPLIADVIQTMDIPGAGSLSTVRIYPLANADAPAVQTILDQLHTGPNAQLIRPEDRPTIAVDNRTNALVISASDKTHGVIETLLKRLDTKATIAMHDVRLIPLKNSEAQTLAPTLQGMMDARVQRQAALGVKDAEALRMLISFDARSNSLIVGGGKEGFELVKSLAQQLDAAAPALGGQIQLLPLVHANSGTLSTTLVELFNQRYQAARTPEVQRQKPIILPDLRTNSLLVAANADDSKILVSLLKKLDVELTDPAVRLEVIPMKHNDAGVVGPSIQQIFQARLQSMTPPGATPAPQDRVDVATDSLSNSLIVSASKENLKLIHDLLKKVDVEPPMETGVVRLYPLENADAQRIATMLQSLVQQGLYKPGAALAAQQSPALAAREKVAIVVDVRTNSLIVSASKENFAVLEEIIRKIDEAGDFGALGDLRLYTLKNADSTQLGPTLQSLFDAKRQAEIDAGGSGRALQMSFVPDARTNTLLVAGSREGFAAVEEILKKLDAEDIVAATQFRVFRLKHATATTLQPTLNQLFTQRVTRGQTRDPVTVIADARANTLIVGASPHDMKLAESLIKQLDEAESKPGSALTSFTLEKADATQVANTLQTLYQGQAAVAGAAPVTIGVDERTNTIVVSAGPADLKRIADLIKQLDKAQLTDVSEIRVFTLSYADAAELSQILTSTLTNKPQPLTAKSPNRQTLLQFISRTKDGKELIATALQEGVLITPDPRSNALIVLAPVRNMPLLEALVHALDSTSPRMAEIRVFTLKNADAQQMVTVLTELFRLQAGAQGAKAVSYTLVTTRPAGETASATIGSSEQDALNVTVDVRTNSLLIGGTKRYVELAAKVIEELDASPAQERVSKVYRLRNAQAIDIQTAMQNFLDQERQRLTQTLGTAGMGAALRLLEREVAIVAEERTNALLLSASPRYFATIETLIEELDQPPPQVLVQVLLAAVRLTDDEELGIEWQLETKWDHFRKSATGGTNFGVSAATDGFTLSVAAGDLRFFLRALEKQGRLEVLSRPQILASDNQLANIDVGSRVPFITQSRVTDQGTTINTITYESVGVILNVTPRINPEGFVRMEVNPEVSALSNSTVTISEGVEAVIIDRRSAETTVTVQDGHTIILGGLIDTKDEDIVRKVPFFGDLPWVGELFRTTHTVKERSELLIILTPHVMRTIPESDRVTDEQLERMKQIRNFKREEVEDYLKKHLGGYFEQATPKDGEGPATQPAAQPATQPFGRSARLPWELPKVRRVTAGRPKELARSSRLDRLYEATQARRRTP